MAFKVHLVEFYDIISVLIHFKKSFEFYQF